MTPQTTLKHPARRFGGKVLPEMACLLEGPPIIRSLIKYYSESHLRAGQSAPFLIRVLISRADISSLLRWSGVEEKQTH